MTIPTREQVRALVSRAIRLTVDDSKIVGFAITPSIDEAITNKYEFVYYLVKFAQEEEREACAKLCDELHRNPSAEPDECAASIRARSNVQQEPQK